MEDTQCIPQREYSRLGEDSQQKATFMTLFGVITALLVLAVIAVLVSCYKYVILYIQLRYTFRKPLLVANEYMR